MGSDGEDGKMPTGRLRVGHVRIAGVAKDEVKQELLELMREEDLPSLSRAVGIALEQWLATRRNRVLNPEGVGDGRKPPPTTAEVLHPAAAEGRA